MAATTAKPFGTAFGDHLTVARFDGSHWSAPAVQPLAALSLHPGAHALHYGSSCFEGLKAYRWADGSVRLFRVDRHAARLRRSAELLYLPCPPTDTLERMMHVAVAANRDAVPSPPGSLYLRPTLIGVEANIGAAGSPSREALLYVLTSPVGDYFAGARALKILIDDQNLRAPPGFGQAKTGGNYAAALRHTQQAKQRYGVDQVLFCPGGDVQETGASNFLLIDDQEILTKPLGDTFLHGVTRDAVLRLAERLQYRVVERDFSVAELLGWVEAGGEAALSGTAAVLSGVGTFVYRDREYPVGDGRTGVNTRRLREALTAIQHGTAEDPFGWTRIVD